MTMGNALPRAVLVGDAVPVPGLDAAAIRRALGLDTAPDLFAFHLDAAVRPPQTGAHRAISQPGQTLLSFNPGELEPLRQGRIAVAVTATNHLTDFGDGGVETTLEALSSAGFRSVGGGRTVQEAAAPSFIDLPTGRLALLAFAELHPRVGATAATATTGGVCPLDPERAVAAVERAAQEADWVWVFLHWGEESVAYPDPEQRRLGRRLAEAGATLVAGSHSHVAMGFEEVAGATLFYGLGNFLLPPFQEARGYHYRHHPRARRGIVAVGTLGAGGWRWESRRLRLDGRGVPHPAPGSASRYRLPEPSRYADAYRRLRRRQQWHHRAQRLLFMSWDERRFRLRQLLGLSHQGAP